MSLRDNNNIETLKSLFEREKQAMILLLGLLSREQNALMQGEHEQVHSCAVEKNAVLSLLNNLVIQRTTLIGKSGNADANKLMNDFLSDHPDVAKICNPLWSEIKNAWLRVRNENKINEKVTLLRLAPAERNLNVFKQAANTDNTYDNDGRINTPSTVNISAA
jgi:flagellar biosynthesis/type III secretory pathway chaperone